jgi:iron complex outermembrane recepter protein
VHGEGEGIFLEGVRRMKEGSNMKRGWFIWLLFSLAWKGIQSQDQDIISDSGSIAFDLAEVQVIAKRSNPFSATIRMDQFDRSTGTDVSKTLELLPGVNYIQVGPRNESMVSIRGFDLRQVPVYLDGVPVYVSYDGYTDLSRFLVSDLSMVSVKKGEASLLLGTECPGRGN